MHPNVARRTEAATAAVVVAVLIAAIVLTVVLTSVDRGGLATAFTALTLATAGVILHPWLGLEALLLLRPVIDLGWGDTVPGAGVRTTVVASSLPVIVVLVAGRSRFAVLLRRRDLLPLWIFGGAQGLAIAVWLVAGSSAVGAGLAYWARVFSGLAVLISVTLLANTPARRRNLVSVVLVGHLLTFLFTAVAVVVIPQESFQGFRGLGRLSGPYHDVMNVAWSGFAGGMAGLVVLQSKSFPHVGQKLLGLAGLVTGAGLLYATFARALWVALLVSTCVWLWESRRRRSLVAVLGLAVAFGAFRGGDIRHRWQDEIAILQGEEDLGQFAAGRGRQWARHFVRFSAADPVTKLIGGPGTGRTENQYLDLLWRSGIVGLGSFLLLGGAWAYMLARAWRRNPDHPERDLLLLGLLFHLAVFLQALTTTVLSLANVTWIYGAIMGLALAVRASAYGRTATKETHAASG